MNSINRKFLKWPAVYLGNKSRIAHVVWKRFGNVDTYIEPFCGSCGVFWKRPLDHFKDGIPKLEILNDRSSNLVNFLRAVQFCPEEVAKHVSWPVTEVDLIARYRYLAFEVGTKKLTKMLKSNATDCDAMIAGWWIWGMTLWMGSDGFAKMAGDNWNKLPELQSDKGLSKMTRVKVVLEDDLRQLKAREFKNKRLMKWFRTLSDRLTNARIACGDWQRVISSRSLLRGQSAGKVGIFLDPPYPTVYETGEQSSRIVYEKQKNSGDKLLQIQKDVYLFCRKNGNENVRIAVCGYTGDGYEKLVKKHGWTEHEWKTTGGFANTGGHKESKAKDNRHRERIFFSPNCLKPATLF